MPKNPDFSLLFKHWLLKLLSVIIGTTLWFFVVGEDRVDLTVTIPLELRNLPSNLVIANEYRKDIEVVISGPRRLIQEMRQQDISRPIDLGKAEPGPMVVKNDAESIALPRGITVQRVQPANITLLVDRLTRKDFTINPVIKGKPAAGFTLESLTLKPPEITLTGPQTVLEQEEALKTTVIDIEGVDSSSTFQVHLDLNEALLRLVGETVIEANVSLKETMVRKTVRGVPIHKAPDSPINYLPRTVTVEADIPERIVRTTSELAALFQASVDTAADKADQEAEIMVRGVKLPEHAPVVIVKITPQKVRILP